MRKLKLKTLMLAFVSMGFLVAGAAQAGSTSSTFTVNATVVPACQINSASSLAFGNYDPVVANATNPLQSTGSIQVTCTKTVAAQVALDQGTNAGTSSTCSAPVRNMKNASGTDLGYNIYLDSGYTNVWGCTDGTNSNDFTSTSGVSPVTLTTYGQIPAGQDVGTGSFQDTVTVTVNF